jgi:SAM-dependent methyltransferase
MKANSLVDGPRNRRLECSGHYRGVLQILQFNWPWYAIALTILVAACAAVPHLRINSTFKGLVDFGIGCAMYWTFASILVSHWIYDLSDLTTWDWIRDFLPAQINRAATIHCGFDESRGAVHRLLPGATIFNWDIYRPELMTEGSIARARKIHPSTSTATFADFTRLPEAENALDAVLLIFAAHEIRLAQARQEFFHELYRVLKPGGTVLLVEHLRDWRNFLAFGPGFLHFLAAKEWRRLSHEAGFLKTAQTRITPFVLVLTLSKPGNL